MFTFSFGSAFAITPWTGEATNKYLTNDTDYKGTGDEGITEAYRAKLLAEVEAIETAVKAGTGYYAYYAPEKAEALKLVAEYKEAIKVAKTAKEAAALKADFNGAAGTAATPAAGALKDIKTKTTVLGDAAALDSDAKIEFTRLHDRNGNANYYLPGYGVIPAASITADASGKYFFAVGYDLGDVITNANTSVPDPVNKFIADWLMDNDYRTKDELKAGTSALTAALVPLTERYVDAATDERDAIQDEIYKYADKYDAQHAKNRLTVADLEAIDALVVKMNDFAVKYNGLNKKHDGSALDLTFKTTEFVTAVDYLAVEYFDQYCSEVSAVPEVKKLTDADKTKVLDLYKKVNALKDTYKNVWKKYSKTPAVACNYNALLVPAYKHFLEKDVKAYGNLDKFSEMEKVGTAPNEKAYFDASEKNVNALKAKRAAFNALVADYGYTDLEAHAPAAMGYDKATGEEALILAAEHNMPADAAYDVKDVTKLQNYLNNATLKVTTNALGNNKIRVQARFDADTYKDIVAECGNDYTISCQFYHKTAAAKTYKAATVKDRNYITYTSKSLKKGTKYKFQCAVLITDAEGNVVAQKDYKASTIGSRVCR